MTHTSAQTTKRSTLVLLAAMMSLSTVFASPVVLAQEADTSGDTTTTQQPTTGPAAPTGDASRTYVYNEATGKWENDYFIWDPVTKKTSPKTQITYSFNPETGRWDTTSYWYNAATGKYEPQVVSVPTPPAGAEIVTPEETTSTQPETYVDPVTGEVVETSPQARSMSESEKSNDSNESNGYNHGGGTNNSATNTTDVDGFFSNYFNGTISHTLNSNAQTGDAAVIGNTIAGGATTGDASATSTMVNMITSLWNIGTGVVNFVADIMGNLFGDITIDPSAIGPNSNNTLENSADIDLTMNNETNSTINNDINLNAGTGNATVSSNTQAGDATTGDATATLNLINMINSAISGNQSFIGTLNIHGSLEGDILFPEGMIDTLIAASGPNSTTTQTNSLSADLDVNLTDNMTINNNLNLNAASGNANVSGNTNAGSATTGDALTNVTMLNMTGREVIGDNAFLVFINVYGTWVGMIMDAPGATAAAVGSNVTTNNQLDLDATLNSTNNSTINNNINLNSQTGDADVSHNTSAGDATTGDAYAGANIANLIGSQFSVADWFGILFINVFGEWNGSFGVDTPLGDAVNVFNNASNNAVTPENVAQKVKVFALNKDDKTGQYAAAPVTYNAMPSSGSDADDANVAGITTSGSLNGSLTTANAETNAAAPLTDRQAEAAAINSAQPVRLIITTMLIAFALLGLEQLLKSGVLSTGFRRAQTMAKGFSLF